MGVRKPAAVNYGREFHTRWARIWLRWFIIDIVVDAAFIAVAVTLAMFAARTWPDDRLQAVIIGCGAIAIAWRILQPSNLRSARKTWRQYIDDRDKAREATHE